MRLIPHPRRSVLWCKALAVACALFSASCDKSRNNWNTSIQLSPDNTVRLAIRRNEPVYPLMSKLRRIGGIAIASLLVGEDGHVVDVAIVAAPDHSIGSALQRAAFAWRFQSVTIGGRAQTVTAKLIYYFDAAQGTVDNVSRRSDRVSGVDQHARSTVMDPGTAPSRAIVLDIRDRGLYRRSRGAAINIPLSELATRVGSLLPRRPTGTRTIITLDCQPITPDECERGRQVISESRIGEVRTLRRAERR